jgi:hypothetical protein
MSIFPIQTTVPAATRPDSQMSLDDFIATASIDKDTHGFTETDTDTRPIVPMPGQRKILNPEEQARLSEETSMEAGDQFAIMADNLNRTICAMIGGEKDEKYKIASGQRRDLAGSYGRIAKHYGFGAANPLVEGIMLTGLIFIPKYREAFADKRINALVKEQEKQKAEISKMKADFEQMKLREQFKQAQNDRKTESAESPGSTETESE